MHLAVRCVLLLAAVALSGCALWNRDPALARAPQPSQSQWWEEHEDKAVFVPGRGYQVPGVPGYFDEFGRPMNGKLDASNYRIDDEPRDAWELLDPAVSYKKIKDELGYGPNSKVAQQLYAQGEKQFQAKQYEQAAETFSAAAERWPDSTVEADALFMSGESNFFSDHYPAANDAYDLLLKKHPGTRHLDQVMTRKFAIGRYWEQKHQHNPHWPITPNLLDKTRHTFDTLGHALKIYESIRLNDPTGPLADDALMATANAHFLNGRWADADYHYSLLRKEYSDSEHQFMAHKLGLQCKLLRYQGPDYDGTPLEEAKELVKQLLVQFPDKLGGDRDRFKEIQAKVAAMQAERDWRLAEYYASQESYGAAKYYYAQVAKEYPSTNLAAQALARIDQYRSKPNVAPQEFAWLVNLFPGESSEPLIATEPAATASDTVQR